MIRVSLPKLDFNEIPAEQQVQALERQLSVLIEQINVSLSAIDPSDILVGQGITLADYLEVNKK